jgi:hypothetical protein
MGVAGLGCHSILSLGCLPKGANTDVRYNHYRTPVCVMTHMKKKLDEHSFMNLYQRAGFSQKEFAEILTRRFFEIGSNRKITPKSIREWNNGKFEPNLTPRETLEMCLVLRCNLYDLVLATSPKKQLPDAMKVC